MCHGLPGVQWRNWSCWMLICPFPSFILPHSAPSFPFGACPSSNSCNQEQLRESVGIVAPPVRCFTDCFFFFLQSGTRCFTSLSFSHVSGGENPLNLMQTAANVSCGTAIPLSPAEHHVLHYQSKSTYHSWPPWERSSTKRQHGAGFFFFKVIASPHLSGSITLSLYEGMAAQFAHGACSNGTVPHLWLSADTPDLPLDAIL